MPINLQKLRSAEIEELRHLFPKDSAILEIGGGNGYQAKLLAEYGCNITSIDIPNRNKRGPAFYPVEEYNGMDIPFMDRQFDIVFSSNVLEHVKDLPRLLQEIRRVTRKNGVSIHIVPTPYWRIWTSVAHYPYLFKYFLSKLGASPSIQRSGTDFVAQHGKWKSFLRILSAGPHGEFPNALAEIYYFSARRWENIFTKNGYSLESMSVNKLFYTGYGLLSCLSLKWRRKLAKYLGSSCYIFVLRNGQWE